MRYVTPTATPPDYRDLSVKECFDRLALFCVGRVAVALPDEAPLVVPVNFVLDGEVIVFRSGSGEKLRRLRQQPVSFQVDHVDVFRRSGWSVLVQGVAYEATPAEVAHLGIEAWAPGEREVWVRLVASSVSGRTIVPADFPLDGRAYI